MDLYEIDPSMLDSISEVVGAGVAVFDVRNSHDIKLVSTNSTFRSMYGLTSQEHNTMLTKDLIDVLGNASIDCAQQLAPIDLEHTLNDRPVWLRVRKIPVLPKQEREVVRIFVTVVDITVKRRLEQDLQVANARLSSIIDSSFEGIITIDTQQRIKSFNHAASRIFGYMPKEVIGQPLEMLIPERFRAQHPDYVKNFQQSNDTFRAMETRVEINALRKSGLEFMAEISLAKINVGGTLEFCAFIRDISEHLRLVDELHRRASTDPLTGLHNRRYTTEEAEKELLRVKRFSHPISVILIDLDDFKSINDDHGHLIGDQVLQHTAVLCRQEARESDIVARWGGEEFVLVLPETDMDGAGNLAERILNQLHRLHFGISELGDRRITASIGVSAWNAEGDGFEEMVYRADQAMYNAKTSGKDKVIRD